MLCNFSPKNHLLALILLILISGAIFANTFNNVFMWDDNSLILENRYIKQLKHLPYIFSLHYWRYHHPGTKGLYRPITTVSFALDYSLWRVSPFGYHLSNLILHIINVLLIYFLVVRLSGKAAEGLLSIPLLTALFFATHPIHTESVTWIKNRADLLALLFFLSALLLFINSIRKVKLATLLYSLSVCAFALALSAKVAAISLPFILLLYIVCFLSPADYKKALLKTIPFFAVIGLYLIYKFSLSGSGASSASASSLTVSTHILVIIKTIGYYFKLLLLPLNLNAERILAVPKSLFTAPVAFSIAAISVVLTLVIKTFKTNKLVCFGLLWILTSLGPFSNIIYLSSRPIAEQRLYIPSLGFCLLLALALKRLSNAKLTAIITICLLSFYSTTTIIRNRDWRDSVTFWTKTAEASSQSARAHNNLGKALSTSGQPQQAIREYRQAIALDPSFFEAYTNLGNLFAETERPDQAFEHYQKAVEINPQDYLAYFNLAVTLNELGRKQEAVEAYRKNIAINPDYGRAYNNLAVILEELGRKQEALEFYEKAAEITPDFATYYNLGSIYGELNRKPEAIAAYKQAIRIDPDDARGYDGLALFYFRNRQYDLALEYSQKAKQRGLVNTKLLNALQKH
ncbi:tetratricopeptide repeat protein [Candidatus Omnitrophota bacterium]